MIGRTDKLDSLNHNYYSNKNNLTVLYGRHGSGKTTLIKEFIKDKSCFYFEAYPGTSFAASRLEEEYDKGIRVFVFEEFQLLVRNDSRFMDAVTSLLNKNEKVMMVLSCSSVAWVENSMVKTIGPHALSINTFMKLKELDYSDFVCFFPSLEADILLKIYGITGGNAAYISVWNENKSIKDNVCELILNRKGLLFNEAFNYVRDEFRETGVYNIILFCLASGRNKLNEIHEYTGFGRDKISVYLKNMIAREIVEKIFSYDAKGSENTRKGLYRIKDGFLDFWYRFVYPHREVLSICDNMEFFDRYIEPGIDEFFRNAFIRIAGEMLEIMNEMNRLPFRADRKGSWYGKTGDIHLIFEDDAGNAIVGQVYEKKNSITMNDFNELLHNVKIAGINVRHFFIFTAGTVEDEVLSDNITIIGINDL